VSVSARGQWVYDPNTGSKKIPETEKRDAEKRIYQAAQGQFKAGYDRLEIHFRSQFCYIDSYAEPHFSGNWPLPD